MIKYLAIAGLAGCAVFASLYAFQSAKLAKTRAALDLATEYISSTKGASDALNNTPDDPDAVLAELCRINPRGEGCGNP